MTRLILKILLLILFSTKGYSQNVTTNDVTFLMNHLKGTYAGYQDKMNGNEKKFEKFVNKIMENESDTFRILGRIISYFDNPHLQLSANNDLQGKEIDSIQSEANVHEIEQYFADPNKLKDQYEGYWINSWETTTIAVIKNGKDSYKGYFINSKSSLVPPGYCIGTIEKNPTGNYYCDFISTRSGARIFTRAVFRNDTTLTVGDLVKWYRKGIIKPILPEKPVIPKLILTAGKLLDKDNYLLTLPDFTSPMIPVIDSIVKADYNKIITAKNLILDIRHNPGGTVRSYAPLIKFVSTRPIVALSGYKLCSEALLQHRRDQIKELSTTKKVDSNMLSELIKDSLKIKNNLGKFVFEPGDTLEYNGTLTLPKNVAIIVDYSVQSAAEMMVLDFKQSKKVKVFGQNTMGAVDYLNIFSLPFPSGRYIFGVSTFKRAIPKGGKPLDFTGIEPDVKISTQDQDWVRFIRKYYESSR